jgi:MFS family permease
MSTTRATIGAKLGSSETLTRTHWVVLASGFLGWLFDSMDLNLFTLVLFPSVAELLGTTNGPAVAQTGALIMAIKLLCWGIGGVVFGVVADRVGRSRTMVITIVIYAGFTGLSAFAQTWWQLAILQALAGFGIGGEWSAGAALIAETWPEKHRARAMQLMQMAFAFGFFVAALDNLLIGPIGGWRWVLALGAVPAVITLGIRQFVPEPERWVRVRAAERIENHTATDTFTAIFKPGLLRLTIVGVLVSSGMMLGCWGGLTLIPSWIVQLSPKGTGVQMVSYAFMLMMVGAALGYLTLIWTTEAFGRRGSYFAFAVASLISSLYLFLMVHDLEGVMWMMPVYGYFVIGGFGTFAAYLPELFPTRVRATGQGFCWNFARSITAIGPLTGGLLVGALGSLPLAASVTCVFFLVGLVAIWFGPETRGMALRD